MPTKELPDAEHHVPLPRAKQRRTLYQAAEEYRALAEHSPDLIARFDRQLRHVYVNAAAARAGRMKAEEYEGKTIAESSVPPPLCALWDARIRKVFETGNPGHYYEDCFPTSAGPRFFDTCLVPERAPDGRVATVLSVARDVSERKRLGSLLFESESRAVAVLNATTEPIVLLDTVGTVLAANTALARRLGTEPDKLVGANLYAFLPPEVARVRRERIEASMRLRQAVCFEDESGGQIFDNCVYPIFDADNCVRGVAGFARDVTERKRAEAALQKAHDELEMKVQERTAQLRNLATELTRAEQKERRRIAAILHDDLQQILTATRMTLLELNRDLGGARRAETVRLAVRWLEGALEVSKSLVKDLRPPILYELGLDAALEWLAEDMKTRFRLSVAIEMGADPGPLSDDLRIFFFEAIRELLFNVVKHAGVGSARVEVGKTPENEVRVEVEDNGAGFDSGAIPRRHLGLLSIREGAQSRGGTLEIDSRPGAGTRVRLTVPYRGT